VADELKIIVTAAGAKQAQADLAGVADAEKKVAAAGAASADTAAKAGGASAALAGAHGQAAAAAGQAAGALEATSVAQEKAGESAKLHYGHTATLLGSLRMLSPELAVVADAILAVKTAQTAEIAALGLFSAAITGVVLVMSGLSAAEDKRRQQAKEVLDGLKAEYDAYLELAKSIDQARIAKERQGGISQEPSRQIVERVATIAKAEGIGTEGMAAAGKVAAAAGPMTDEELRLLMLWEQQGGAERYGAKAPIEEAYAFRADIKKPGRAAEMIAAQARWKVQEPQLAARGTAQAEAALRGLTPQAETGRILEDAAKEMNKTSKELEVEIGESIEAAVNTYTPSAVEHLKELVGRQDRLRLARFKFPTEENLRREGWFPPQIYTPQAETGEPGISVGEVIGKASVPSMTIINNHYNQGQTHYVNQDKVDPAGRPNEPAGKY